MWEWNNLIAHKNKQLVKVLFSGQSVLTSRCGNLRRTVSRWELSTEEPFVHGRIDFLFVLAPLKCKVKWIADTARRSEKGILGKHALSIWLSNAASCQDLVKITRSF